MKKLICFFIFMSVASVYAEEPQECIDFKAYKESAKGRESEEGVGDALKEGAKACETARLNQGKNQRAADAQRIKEEKEKKEKEDAARAASDKTNKATAESDKQSMSNPAECNKHVTDIDTAATDTPTTPEQIAADARRKTYKYKQCRSLIAISKNNKEHSEEIKNYGAKYLKASADTKIKCIKYYSITLDYEACEKALAAYNFIMNSEMFMNLEQTVRTDVKTANINKEATKQAASGDSQGAMLDSAEATNKHMKSIETEKMVAYSTAVSALGVAMYSLVTEDEAYKTCLMNNNNNTKNMPENNPSDNCKKVMEDHKEVIVANKGVRGPLWEAMANFTAKGLAAGIKMKQYGQNADKINQVKKNLYEDGSDMMVEMCTANPTDPACINSGERVSNTGAFGAGDLSFGGDGSNNVFGATPGSSEFGEVGADTSLDDKNSVAGINSPFKDDAKRAKGILNPAAAAQTQAGAAPAGGGAGGGGGGGGGGSASLGSDLSGADPDGDKEAQIKTGKVSGTYGSVGGGGYKGLGKGKDDSNPFASLFDQKGGGGVEEDRSIASGDIDGKASGLFEKISKRYGQVQADKRVETKNLE